MGDGDSDLAGSLLDKIAGSPVMKYDAVKHFQEAFIRATTRIPPPWTETETETEIESVSLPRRLCVCCIAGGTRSTK